MLSPQVHFHSFTKFDVKELPSKFALAAHSRNPAADLDAFINTLPVRQSFNLDNEHKGFKVEELQ